MADGGNTAGAALDIKLHHFAVAVPDLQQALDWYGRVLGFELERTLDVPGAKIAVARRGDLRVEFMQAPGVKPLPDERRAPTEDIKTQGNKHVCFAVRDLAAATETLKARGAEVAADLGVAVYFRDLFGNLFEIVPEPERWA